MSVQNKLIYSYNKLLIINKKIHNVLEMCSGLVLGLSAFVILFQVFYRFIVVKFVSFSFPFTEEFARYLIIWSAYLIVGVCLSEGSHASVDVLAQKIPPKGKLINYYIIRLIMLFFLITVLIESKDLLKMMSRFKTPTMRMPSHILYFSVTFGCISMLWEIILEMFGVILKQNDSVFNITEDV